ncbi:PREDICTED: putative nuclear RNA export factor SDE5 isoform X2 [Nelumbo nucifera]|uniref:Nuclear RNA export factor SDE5 isoform X2 n=1 Tax=Nelumbo nucifera TaxID=4432 RepID=A0A1U7YXX8_NELNU|nr:PREDICTED: putative nuclear RNA export factor SDE5 isoform X2 [Nelumbo nucifera]
MERSSSCSLGNDDEGRALEILLDAFGAVFSLKDIAAAYCKAKSDANKAAEILVNLQGDSSDTFVHPLNNGLRDTTSSVSSSDDISEKLTCAYKDSKTSKPRRYSASMGTVSSVIGKEYIRPTQVQSESCKATKPLKLDSKDLPESELWQEDGSSSTNETMHKDMEEFLFRILGDGFQLRRDVIQEVLGLCGYDMEKSMEKLLDMSTSTLEKNDDIIGVSAVRDNCSKPEFLSHEEKLKTADFAQIDRAKISNANGVEPHYRDKQRYDLQKEVLTALFTVPERPEEVSRRARPPRAVRGMRGTRRTVVVEPPSDAPGEHSTRIVELQQNTVEDNTTIDEEDSYEVLRRAVKEYWVMMKEYYRAAADAFVKGDHAQSNALLERGQFYYSKAREADEKSSQKILESRPEETRSDLSIDLHEHDAKEAIRLLKVHLTSLSGIPAFQYLKVIVETNAEDTTKGARKRLVIKLLEKESISWTEEANGGIIVIQLDKINPKKLSFARKSH